MTTGNANTCKDSWQLLTDVQKVIAEAQAQLQQYGQDARVREILGPATPHPLILVYSGWDLVYREEWAETMPVMSSPA